MKLHAVFGFFGVVTLFASFLVTPRVAPTCYAMGAGYLLLAIILKTIENYENDQRKRDKRNNHRS